MQKSFIMVRPDGSRILDGIDSLLRKEDFNIENVYHIPKWDELYLLLHEKEISDPDNVVSDNIKLNIWMSKTLYGNHGLIIQLSNNKYGSYEDLIKKTYEFKFLLREQFQDTRDGKFVIALNADKLDISMNHLSHYGNLVVASEEKQYPFSEKMQAEGNYLPAYFNYIHCPEEGLVEIASEYEIMNKNGILTKANELTNIDYQKCIKMRSCFRP